jgi:hypothetical protein
MGTADQLEYAYAGDILKWDDNGDGTINVYGAATDPSEDLDGQGCDPLWLAAEMPAWFKFANVREQHGPVAAGVGKELERADGDKWMLKTHVVDANTVKKVKAGVLKGYSIGVRNGKVRRDKAAGYPNGRIVGGKIVEISLVDRPCNPNATITICKAAPGSDDLDSVEPLLEDIDPSMYIGEEIDVSSGDDEDETAQAVEIPVDADDDGADDAGDELSLFDEFDAEYEAENAATALGQDITKGLLESLVHGVKKPAAKKDGDGDGKVGEQSESSKRAAQRRKNREFREAEAEKDRKHRAAMDAEAAQDANRAQRQGRRMEAGEHRARIGEYRKAEGMSAADHRDAVRLAREVNSGVITKAAAREVYDEANDIDGAQEVIRQLAELIMSEAEELGAGRYEEIEDIEILMEACRAVHRFLRREQRAGGVDMSDDLVIRKSAGLAVDESTAEGTLDVAEIVKAAVAEQFSEVTKAQEAEIANLRAQVAKMAATPLPSGLVVNKSVMPSAPAHNTRSAMAAQWEAEAAKPGLSTELRNGYLELAARARVQG